MPKSFDLYSLPSPFQIQKCHFNFLLQILYIFLIDNLLAHPFSLSILPEVHLLSPINAPLCKATPSEVVMYLYPHLLLVLKPLLLIVATDMQCKPLPLLQLSLKQRLMLLVVMSLHHSLCDVFVSPRILLKSSH